jgi:glycosyltransferase involved in cell wall biosynthesis
MDGGTDLTLRIAVISRAEPHGGGSFQYGASILQALSSLSQNEYDITFWHSSSSWDVFAETLPFQHIRVDNSLPFGFRLVRKLVATLNIFLRNKAIGRWLDCDAMLHTVRRQKAHICICLEQAYNPLPDSIRVIGPVHDLMHRYEGRFPEVGAPAEYDGRERLFSRHVRHAAAVLVDSRVGKQHVIESYGADEDKVHILPYIPSRMLSADFRRPVGLPDDVVPFVFYPAQFWPHKNHVAIVQALALLGDALPLHCVFTGSTDKAGYSVVAEAVKQAGLEQRVHILGYVEECEISWLYKNAFALVMPTFFGPTNIPPLEAFKYGCPAIVSRIYGMPDQLGDAALYFDPQRPEEIAEELRRLALSPDLRNELINKGHKKLEQWKEVDFQQCFLTILEQVFATVDTVPSKRAQS